MTAPYHPVLSDEQRANLRKLAAYLLSLPAEYPKFEMNDFAPDVVLPANMHECGTAACAAGHGPLAGIPAKEREDWASYSYRAFVDPTEQDELEDGSQDPWCWCFAGGWSHVDNTAHGAASRILWMLEHGVPVDALLQRFLLAPLSYAVPA